MTTRRIRRHALRQCTVGRTAIGLWRHPDSRDEVAVLQRRGPAPREYADGTLREKLFGAGPRYRPGGPGVRRRIAQGPRKAMMSSHDFVRFVLDDR